MRLSIGKEPISVSPKAARQGLPSAAETTGRRGLCRGRGSVPARHCAGKDRETFPWDARDSSIARGRASLRTRTGGSSYNGGLAQRHGPYSRPDDRPKRKPRRAPESGRITGQFDNRRVQ